ncbi:MAG: hypothetical protein OEW75_16430 [Cyclobacteriaceae bacterium]|nr:hypothetical protein [Cyclobacteriaceae bacterium]
MRFGLIIAILFLNSCSVQQIQIEELYRLKDRHSSGHLLLKGNGKYDYQVDYHSITIKSNGNYRLNNNLILDSKYKLDTIYIGKYKVDSIENIQIKFYDIYSNLPEQYYADCEGIIKGSTDGIVKFNQLEKSLNCKIINFNFRTDSSDTTELHISKDFNYYEIRKPNTLILLRFEDFSGSTIRYKKRKIIITTKNSKLVFVRTPTLTN